MNSALLQWSLLETRWRFVIGLILLSLGACGGVLTYPSIAELLPQISAFDAETFIGREINESLQLTRTFEGFVWSSGIRQNMTQMLTLFAALLGTSAQLLPGANRSLLFILSLPVTRSQLFITRTVTGLLELLLLSLIPAFLIALMAPAIGEHYALLDSLVHGISLFIVATVFFSLAAMLSTVFDDPWRPLLISVGVAMGLALLSLLTGLPSLFAVMANQAWFESHSLPWGGFLLSLLLSALMLYTGVTQLQRRDF